MLTSDPGSGSAVFLVEVLTAVPAGWRAREVAMQAAVANGEVIAVRVRTPGAVGDRCGWPPGAGLVARVGWVSGMLVVGGLIVSMFVQVRGVLRARRDSNPQPSDP
jgi:hypothetical protein